MSHPKSNIKHYLSLIPMLVALNIQPSTAQTQVIQLKGPDATTLANTDETAVELNQAELDQLLAPIALYPDTLLSHILVAATYPLEVIQAARWRAANEEFDEDQALNAVEDKDWDPSVKALIPFNELLQKFSDDLDWLQSLGDAFLNNEGQVLSTVQNLRQKAYAQGNLNNNDYLEVNQENDQITIQPVNREVIYVPYYDTRVVYGPWWWDTYQPYYWTRPASYVWHSGFYWSHRYTITPTFYFGGFRWRERYVYADYNYRSRGYRNWSHSNRQVVLNREYSKWQHNQVHRRGVHYTTAGKASSRDYRNLKTNPNRYVTHSTEYSGPKRQQLDKQRVLDINEHKKERTYRTEHALHDEKRAQKVQRDLQTKKYDSHDRQRSDSNATQQQWNQKRENKQRDISANAQQQRFEKQEKKTNWQSANTQKQQKTDNQRTEKAQNNRQEQSHYRDTNKTNRQRESSQNNDRSQRGHRSESAQRSKSNHAERRSKE
ncbi:MAG: DUF3300 domain-containing protein [Paraglaciecola sp.]|uniref:DUF3300 domain-containing protein n=1 Tax=Paraglaciecola sp. TaxID=1920173 RepID=UPI00273D691A|nr:DUF3300 domain-containing protein [Paraglaciecola sp.]MDP5033145.1 DUF3300 domain-containing protein [Paraglaciecola sp.]MDP5130209.1 DUF3300 domain-containing protein [Paraglaciecola sp.]